MKIRIPTLLLITIIAASLACAGTAQVTPGIPTVSLTPGVPNTPFSAEATSPVSVALNWKPVDGAASYLVEGRYGTGDYFQVAELSDDHMSFTHFVVPGSTGISYRLSASTGAGLKEIGNQSLTMPELTANPLVVETTAFPPAAPSPLGIPAFPTIDPTHPDPVALATAMAAFQNLNPSDLVAQTQPVLTQKEIRPEGGDFTLTDPNNVIYTLTFPANAVGGPTTITMTPIQTLSSSPFTGGLLAGVQVSPPIPFAGPVNLTITLPSTAPAAGGSSIIGFAVSSSSHELSLTPIYDQGQNTYTMSAYWGDTFGLAVASPDEVAAQAARLPSDSRAQMEQVLAALRATDPDRGPEGDARVAVQVLKGLLQQAEAHAGRTSPNGDGRLAAPAINASSRTNLKYESAVELFSAVFWSEAIWNFLSEMLPPGSPPPPGSELAKSMSDWKTRIVDELTAAIKAYMDAHDGCRTGLGLYAESFRQLLRSPGTPFQQALANNYRARFGAPPNLQCEFRLKIAKSLITNSTTAQDPQLGNSIWNYGVHGEPWSLELVNRDGRLFLRGPLGATYDTWDWTLTKCPPKAQLRPFPTSLIWITDLTLVFDKDDNVSDFSLQGVTPDLRGGGEGMVTTDMPKPGQCKLLSVKPGANPVDHWGIDFSTLHNSGRHLDNWAITGEDSYVATDTIAGRVEGAMGGQLTENTTLVLTVNRK